MKRLSLFLLAVVLCLSFCACSGSADNNPSADTFTKPDHYATVVLVTINPQVRLYLDQDGKVLAVEPVNKDAKKLVKELDFQNKPCEEVVSEFVAAANADGFVKEDAQIEIEIVESGDDQAHTQQILETASESAQAAAEELQISVVVVRKPQQDKNDPNKQPAKHKHTFTEATCSAPATCTECGAMKGNAKGHDWEDPTCATTKRCKICGATDGTSQGHNWEHATCTAPKTCKTCGATDGEPKGHKWENATCTAPKTCQTCGATDGDMAKHSWKSATCTDPKTCTTCGTTEGNPKGHTYTGGVCSSCNAPQKNYKALDTGIWTANAVVNGRLYKIRLSFQDPYLSVSYGSNIHSPNFDADFREALLQDYQKNPGVLTVIDGVYFYCGMGDSGPLTYTVSGDSIQIDCDDYIHLTLRRTAGDQLTITQSDILGEPTGIVLTWSEN